MEAWKRRLALAAIGSVLTPVGDHAHISSGATGYDYALRPMIASSPWWFVLSVVAFVVVLGEVATQLQRSESQNADLTSGGAGLVATCLVVWSLSAALPFEQAYSVTVALSAMTMIGWAAFERTRTGLIVGVLAGAIGTATEMLLVSRGWFHYAPVLRQISGVPTWLFAIHFSAGVAVSQLTRVLNRGASTSST